jgi:hypothetical protein
MLARVEQTVDIEPAPAKAGVPMASPRAAASVRSLSGVRLAIAPDGGVRKCVPQIGNVV